jgi:hypothetical protein
VVGDHVVQLARDPHTLVEHRPARVPLALALERHGAIQQLRRPPATRAQRAAQRPHRSEERQVHDQRDQLVESPLGHGVGNEDAELAPEHDHDGCDAHPDGHVAPPWRTVGGGAEDRNGDGHAGDGRFRMLHQQL